MLKVTQDNLSLPVVLKQTEYQWLTGLVFSLIVSLVIQVLQLKYASCVYWQSRYNCWNSKHQLLLLFRYSRKPSFFCFRCEFQQNFTRFSYNIVVIITSLVPKCWPRHNVIISHTYLSKTGGFLCKSTLTNKMIELSKRQKHTKKNLELQTIGQPFCNLTDSTKSLISELSETLALHHMIMW